MADSDQENIYKSGLLSGPSGVWKVVMKLFKSYLWEEHACLYFVKSQIQKLS